MKTRTTPAFLVALPLWAGTIGWLSACAGMKAASTPPPDASALQKIECFKNELIKTDKEFSTLAQEEGMGPAFIEFAADDVVLVRESKSPIVGKKALIEQYEKFVKGTIDMTWKPDKIEVAADGSLGYTFGAWELKGKDKDLNNVLLTGLYTTIWKRQADGSWKFVYDVGVTQKVASTPAPKDGEKP